MFRHNKYLVLKRLNRLMRLKLFNSLGVLNQPNLVPDQDNINEDEDEDDFQVPMLDIPFELLPYMSNKQRKKLQQQYPNLPPYIFMNNKEKIRFFERKGIDYQKKLNSLPKRISKTKKIVKFKSKFDVRPFNATQKVTKINQTKSFQDSYRKEHFS